MEEYVLCFLSESVKAVPVFGNNRVFRPLVAIASAWGLLALSVVSLPVLPGGLAVAADQPTADLVVNFRDVPHNATSGDAFTYQVEVENLGPQAAQNSQVVFDLGTTTTYELITCQGVNGALCPDASHALNQVIPSLPARSSVIFTISGHFPAESSTTHRVTATLPDTMTDVDTSSNSVEQQIALYLPQVSVTKTQDLEEVRAGEPRTYTVTYQNTGSSPVSVNMKDEYASSRAANKIVRWTVACGRNTHGMDCPAGALTGEKTLQIQGMSGSGNSNYSGVNVYAVDDVTMPPQATVEFLVTVIEDFDCVLDADYSAVYNRGYITPRVTNVDSVTDRVEGRVVAPRCVAPRVRVTKEQDKESVGSGESRTYTVRYENEGDTSATIDVTDAYSSAMTADKTVTWSATCGGRSTVDCPASIDGQQHTHQITGHPINGNSNLSSVNLFSAPGVELPAGGVLEIIVPVVEEFTCLLDADYSRVSNRASFTDPKTGLTPDASVAGIITGERCAPPPLTVTKSVDREEVASGQPRTYTVTYRNSGNEDVTVELRDDYSTSTSATKTIAWSARCGGQTSGMTCPEAFDGNEHTRSYEGRDSGGNNNFNQFALFSVPNVTIPAAATLEILVPVTETFECTLNIEDSLNTNVASYVHPPTKLQPSAHVSGLVRHSCGTVDVSTSLNAQLAGQNVAPDEDVTVRPSDVLTVIARVENSRGTATDFLWTIQLPSIVDVAADVQPACVASPGVACPAFTFDPQRKTLSAQVAALPAGGYIEARFDTTVNKTSKKRASSKVQATAPVQGDTSPVEGTDNPSSITLGYSPDEVPLPTPEARTSCEPEGQAQWVKPQDSAQISWELTAQGHLIAHSAQTVVLRNPATGELEDTHDYGVAVNNPQDCPRTPEDPQNPPPVTTPNDPPASPPQDPSTTPNEPPIQPPGTQDTPPAHPPVLPPAHPPVLPPVTPGATVPTPPADPSKHPSEPVITPVAPKPRTLPSTGASMGGMIPAALLSVLAGAGALILSRRKHR